MNLEVALHSKAKSGLNTNPGLSSSAQGGAEKGKNSSFLQILRPKTGSKANAVAANGKALAAGGRPVAVGQGTSKAKVSGAALSNTKPTDSTKEPRKAINKHFGDIAGRASQALKKSKKQSGDISVPAVPLGQALEQTPAKSASISLKKQSGIMSGNLAKATLVDVARGQAENGSRISISRESSTPITKGNASGAPKKGEDNAAKTGNRVADAATEKTQNKQTSVIAAMPKAANKSGGEVSRANEGSTEPKPSVDGVLNEGRKISGQATNKRVGTPVTEGTTRGTTTTQVTVPGPIADKTSISKGKGLKGAPTIQSIQTHRTVSNPGELNRSNDKANETKPLQPTRSNQIVAKKQHGAAQTVNLPPELRPSVTTKPQPPTLSTIAQPKRSEKTTPLGQAGIGSSPPPRFSGATVESNPKETRLFSNEGDQILRPDAVTRKASVSVSRERLLTNNRPSVPNTPYPVKEAPRQSHGLPTQKTEVRSLHSMAAQQTVRQTVTALKSLPISKALLPVSKGGKQKKPFAVTPKPTQRHRELTHNALAKKLTKPAAAHAASGKGVPKTDVGGMEDAFLKLDMNLARRMEQTGNPRQNMPYGGLAVSREVGNHASVAAEMIEAGRSDLSHIKDVTVRNDFANRLNQADVELQSLQAKSTQSKGQPSVNAIVYRQVMSAVETFRGMTTSRWAMTIEPSNDLRIQLDLRMSDSQLVVQAKLERGAQAVLGSGWSELQASLAEKDVDLRSLTTANPKEGHSNMFEGKKERQSGNAKQDDESWFSEELSELLAEFEKEAQVPGKAKRNRSKARMAETNFESWA